jgi:lauroyl/myristoyl acyltransferase
MVFGESPLKDAYRRVVWGPYREILERSPWGWEYRANRRLGHLAALFAGRKVDEVEANLRRAFPGRTDLRAVARDAMGTHFLNQYASFAFGRIDKGNWSSYVRFEGLGHVEAAARAGQGVVLLHPHMGPAQLPLCVLGVLGFEVHQIGGGEPAVEKSEVGRWATETRHRLEARMPVKLHTGGSYLRGLIRALSSGGIVLTAADGTGGGQEIGRRYRRKVLGLEMGVPVGGFYLALKGNARLHPLHTVRDPTKRGRHVTIIGPEAPVRRDIKLDDALELGADWTAAYLSEVLTEHPGEWHFWDGFAPGGLLAQ